MKNKIVSKIDVISGFTGAGKTTLINKLLEYLSGKENVVVLENEFGEIGIDGSILSKSGVQVKEISGGCICCTLHGNFVLAIRELIDKYKPERILVEPTGLGKLSDVLSALETAKDDKHEFEINMLVSVLDPLRFSFYKEMFGDFFFDQLVKTNAIIFSRSQSIDSSLCEKICNELKCINSDAYIITKPWEDISSEQMLYLLEEASKSKKIIFEILEISECHNHQQHDHKHHHNYQEEFGITSVSFLPSIAYSEKEFKNKLNILMCEDEYGIIIRGKGYFKTFSNRFYRFDYVYNELNLCEEKNIPSERLVFIGKNLNESAIKKLFSFN